MRATVHMEQHEGICKKKKMAKSEGSLNMKEKEIIHVDNLICAPQIYSGKTHPLRRQYIKTL